MQLRDVAEAIELIMLAMLRVAEGGDASLLDAHLTRMAPLRQEQGLEATDIRDGFAEIEAGLRDAVAERGVPPWPVVATVVAQTERRALELFGSGR